MSQRRPVVRRLPVGDDVFHTYTAYARGSESLLGTFAYLDLTPSGRPHHVGQVRHHDRYGDDTHDTHVEFLQARYRDSTRR